MAAPAPPPTRIFVVRHGQTEGNRDGIFCGHGETRLTELGRRQARALGERLARVELHAAYTSDLSRAVETAAIALEGRGLTPRVDPAFRELHYGEWELQKERAIARSHPEQFRLMREEDPAWHPPGGENVLMVRERTFAALARLVNRHKNQNVLLVTHGTAINCMLSAVLGMAPEYTFRFAVANGGLSEVRARGRMLRVVALNDTSHLEGLAGPAAGV